MINNKTVAMGTIHITFSSYKNSKKTRVLAQKWKGI